MLSKALLVLSAVACAGVVRSATLTVDLNGNADYSGIQAAIDAAADGDTVLVMPGEYVITQPINFNRLHDPDDPASPALKNIIVNSERGADVTTIGMAEGPESAFVERVEFLSGESEQSSLCGFTLMDGLIGLVCSDSSPAVTDCIITTNSADGVFCSGTSSPTLANCTIMANDVGVACTDRSAPTFSNCTITGNCRGIVVSGSEGSPAFTHCTIAGNLGDAVLCSNFATAALISCIVWDNLGASIAGETGSVMEARFSCIEGDGVWPGPGNLNEDPLFCRWEGPEVSVNDQEGFERALGGFSLALSARSPCIGRGEDGAAMGADVGVCGVPGACERLVRLAPGTYRMAGMILPQGVSVDGSGQEETAISVGLVGFLGLRTGTVLSNVTVTGEDRGMTGARKFMGDKWCGAITVAAGQAPEIRNCTISGSRGGMLGGGVYCERQSSPTLANCTISDNGVSYFGGGLYCEDGASPILTNCTISGNTAYDGGGVYCDNAFPTLINCRVSGNRARWKGGGVHCCCGGSKFTNCTISGNAADIGGAVYCSTTDSATFTNCIVWDNVSPPIAGTPAVTYSCVEHTAVWPGEGNTNQDPLFVRAGHWNDNGTPDEINDDVWIEGDYRIQSGSPCIDTGTSEGAPTTDIEGNGRPCGAGVDMGAYEMGACPADARHFVRGDTNTDAALDIADAVFTLSYLFAAGTAPSCLDAADANDDGAVDIADAIAVLSHLFAGSGNLPEPFGECGIDPTVDDLGCESFPPCE